MSDDNREKMKKTYHPEPPYRLKQSVWLFVRPIPRGMVRHLDQYTETDSLCQYLFILFPAKDLIKAFQLHFQAWEANRKRVYTSIYSVIYPYRPQNTPTSYII